MHATSLTPIEADAVAARRGGRHLLAQALQASRCDTLATFAACAAALPDLAVPMRAELNPPLWELGHIGWFQEYWLARNPAWREGAAADPAAPRRPGVRANADALYNSSLVPHDSRWALALPDAATTQAELAAQQQATLALLQHADAGSEHGDELYFFRLALLHEDMHHEAALYMAQGLGLPIEDARWQPRALPAPAQLTLPAGPWRLGSAAGRDFAFDNELGAHELALPATRIDAQALRWAEFMPFVEAGGYAEPCWWDDAGRAWLARHRPQAPRYLKREASHWQQWRHGRWQELDPQLAACHLTQHEALAWCRWAGRRLPTEAEWERAALTRAGEFRWGDVWEWTASPFAPYPGFVAHPYRDYSAPWFDGRPVLRGASFMTQPRLRHPRFRNYFPAQRNDVPAGLRSCAL
jgi:ergothioneine biosynthesis protein EgtB